MIEKYQADSERIARQLIDMAAELKKEDGVCLIFLHKSASLSSRIEALTVTVSVPPAVFAKRSAGRALRLTSQCLKNCPRT